MTLQLEDIYTNLDLNFTMRRNHYDYRRQPNMEYHPAYMSLESPIYFEIYYTLVLNGTHCYYKYYDNQPNYFRAVKIKTINVTGITDCCIIVSLNSEVF